MNFAVFQMNKRIKNPNTAAVTRPPPIHMPSAIAFVCFRIERFPHRDLQKSGMFFHIRAESFEGAVVFGMSARNLSKAPSYFRLMRVHPFLQTRLLFRHSMHRRFVRC